MVAQRADIGGTGEGTTARDWTELRAWVGRVGMRTHRKRERKRYEKESRHDKEQTTNANGCVCEPMAVLPRRQVHRRACLFCLGGFDFVVGWFVVGCYSGQLVAVIAVLVVVFVSVCLCSWVPPSPQNITTPSRMSDNKANCC